MRDYGVARSLFGFIEFLFWAGVVIGVIVAFAAMNVASRGFGGGPGILAALPGMLMAITSLFGVALVQNARATVDTAELTQQMLKVARDQLEVSQQAVKQGEMAQQSFAALAASNQPPQSELETPAGKATFAHTPGATDRPQIEATSEPEEPKVMGKKLTYKGQSGELIGGKWHLNGIAFESRELLRDYIDVYGRKPLPRADS